MVAENIMWPFEPGAESGAGPGSEALAFAQDARADESARSLKTPCEVNAVMLVSPPPR
jgi:hypothetical protein